MGLRGKRLTIAGFAIRRVLQEATHPLHPDEIRKAARPFINKDVSIRVIYHNIKSLRNEGLVEKVSLLGSHHDYDIARWEWAGKPHHHHFHCMYCDIVFCMAEGCPMDNLPWARFLPADFKREHHHFMVQGRCKKCRNRKYPVKRAINPDRYQRKTRPKGGPI